MARHLPWAGVFLCAFAAVQAAFAEEDRWPALRLAQGAAESAQDAASQPNPVAAHRIAQVSFDGPNAPSAPVGGNIAGAAPGLRPNLAANPDFDPPRAEPPAPSKVHTLFGDLPPSLVYGGSAVIGGVTGWFTGGGWIGALGGAAMGVASAYFFTQGDYGASIGISVGSLIGSLAGSFLGGPLLGGLIGGVIGGIVGHFLGQMFS